MRKVAIIGAGAAGLCAARHMLCSNGSVGLEPVIFEQSSVVGGTWVYEESGNKKHVFSSIYKNLMTNLPKQVMCFPDFAFPDHLPSFMHHTEVRKYLENYAEHFNVLKCIRFQTKVICIDPLPKPTEDEWCRWIVKYQQNNQEVVQCEEFDAVVVCNGHYSVPYYPSIPGLDNYKGKQIHSHHYRDPNDYTGTKKALVLGFGPSGTDITLELSNVCENVYVSHKGVRCSSKLPENTVELSNLSHVNEDGSFVTESNDIISDIDLFVICTGYQVKFPFLGEKVILKTKYDRIIENLYKMLFCIDHPSLSIVGLPWQTAPFPLMHQQCAYVTSILDKTKVLPNCEEMLKDTTEFTKQRLEAGHPDRYLHKLGPKQFEYSDMLADLSGHEKNPKVIENLYNYVGIFRKSYMSTYRDMDFKQINNDEFEVLQAIEE